jgi:hypothetical protein
MSQQAEAFVQRLMDVSSLRAEFQRAPEETAARAGLDLSAADVRALKSVDWGDEQLIARASGRAVIGACTPDSDVNLKENIVPVAWDN